MHLLFVNSAESVDGVDPRCCAHDTRLSVAGNAPALHRARAPADAD
jgi:hypothetical protein